MPLDALAPTARGRPPTAPTASAVLVPVHTALAAAVLLAARRHFSLPSTELDAPVWLVTALTVLAAPALLAVVPTVQDAPVLRVPHPTVPAACAASVLTHTAPGALALPAPCNNLIRNEQKKFMLHGFLGPN